MEHDMTKAWLAGVAAFAMMTGVALAQSSSTTTTTVVPGEYSSHRSERTIDSYGGQTDRSTTYSTGNGGTERRDTTTTRSSGPYVPYAPYGDSTTTRSTTTTVR
jgi:hypothetical protein